MDYRLENDISTSYIARLKVRAGLLLLTKFSRRTYNTYVQAERRGLAILWTV